MERLSLLLGLLTLISTICMFIFCWSHFVEFLLLTLGMGVIFTISCQFVEEFS